MRGFCWNILEYFGHREPVLVFDTGPLHKFSVLRAQIPTETSMLALRQ